MTIEKKPVVRQRIFEARFERGYRYLDRCGEAMIMLEDLLSRDTPFQWLPQEMAPTGARLICLELDITIVFDAARLIVDWDTVSNDDLDFDQLSEDVLATITGRFDLQVWRRFGSRRISWVATDSIEEAEAISVGRVPVNDWRPDDMATGFEVRELALNSTFELPDRSKGVRLRLYSQSRIGAPSQLDERLRIPSHHLPSGQHHALVERLKRKTQREKKPEAGFAIDIDYYWIRPPKGATVKSFLAEARQEADKLQNSFWKARK